MVAEFFGFDQYLLPYIHEKIWFAVEEGGGKFLNLGAVPWAQAWPFPWALVAPFPTKRSEACLERSDKVQDCRLHKTHRKSRT